MLEELRNIKSGEHELREFGITIGGILVFIGAFAFYRERNFFSYFLIAGCFFAVAGIALPLLLKPLHKIWMGFSIIIGFFMSRVMLTILFYLVVTPLGVIIRLTGKDILDQKIEKGRESYWIKRDGTLKNRESYENQY